MSNVMEIQRGDVVRLKSGGPDMTVTGRSEEQPDNFYCQWFVDGHAQEGWFPAIALVKSTTVGSSRTKRRSRG